MLIPCRQQIVTVRFQVPHNITEFVGWKTRVDSQCEVVQPELGLLAARPNVNVRRLAAFVRVEVRSIGSSAQNCGHVISRRLGPTMAASPSCRKVAPERLGWTGDP
jgi:hypothetical protein